MSLPQPLLESIRAHRPIVPDHIRHLRSVVNTDIERKGNQAAAVAAANDEQIKRIQVARLHDALQECVRRVQQNKVRADVDEEQSRRVAEQWMRDVVAEQVRSVAARKQAAAAAAQEQADRISNGPSVADDTVSLVLHEINAEIAALGNRVAAAELARQAASENAHGRAMHLVCEEIGRRVARTTAQRQANNEWVRRVTEQWMHEVVAEVRSTTARKAAAKAAKAEQQARTEASGYWMTDAEAIANAKSQVNASIRKLGNKAKANACFEQGRAEQVHEHVMKDVCEEMRRVVARHNAWEAGSIERDERVAIQRLHEVVDQLRRVYNTRLAAIAADDEQRARLQKDNSSHWTTDPTVIANTKSAVNADIERLGRENDSRQQAAKGLAEQVHAFRMASVCQEVERAVARKNAKEATANEQAQRATIDRLHGVCDELRRTHGGRAADEAAAAEQRARTCPDTYWTIDPAAISAAKHAVNAEVVRAGNKSRVLCEMNIEQAERIQAHLMADVVDQVRRYVAQKMADSAMELVREQAKTRHAFETVAHELVDQVHRRDARLVCAAEQKSRVESPVEPSPEFVLAWRKIQDSIELGNSWENVTPVA